MTSSTAQMRRFGILAALLVLGACANPAAERATAAQTALVGMPEQALLACAGVPDRTAVQGDIEYFTYDRSGTGGYGWPSASVGVGGGSSSGVGVGVGFGFPVFGGGRSNDCEATFTLRNGVVQQLQYRAGDSVAACAPIVQSCLGPG